MPDFINPYKYEKHEILDGDSYIPDMKVATSLGRHGKFHVFIANHLHGYVSVFETCTATVADIKQTEKLKNIKDEK